MDGKTTHGVRLKLSRLFYSYKWQNSAPRLSKTNKNQNGQGKTGFNLYKLLVFVGFYWFLKGAERNTYICVNNSG